MVDNKSYRYGDGLFETMKITGKNIALEKYHFERFFSGLKQMRFEIPPLFTAESLKKQILVLCEKNKCDVLARVRLSVFRGNGGLYEGNNDLQYVIECWRVDESVNQLNGNGFVIDVYPDVRKSCDKFSNIKSANYLPYVMAARYAKENKLNECLVLNMYDRIADGITANIFLIKDQKIITPPLSEGCVNGVMRRYLIERQEVKETVLTIEDILSADELFFTNAMFGIRWAKQFRDKMYTNLRSEKIHDEVFRTIWS
ncbi:MAG TPA: aminotransferase class IV [Chitinophagaceae bacterium]|nr:aminotransferase class IV [Chitinophagaceae bacterium]